MAKKYLIYKANAECCDAGTYNNIVNWSYKSKNGGNVDFVENTYWRGNSLEYIWIQADSSEIDNCGNLVGDLQLNIRCLSPCVLEQVVSPLTIVQTGGFAMPTSRTEFRGMSLGNCTGPTVLSPLPPNVQGFDVPIGNKITVQMFGGFGMARTINASNNNLGGATQPITNRRLVESANSTDGFFVPWLKDKVPGQIQAGKKMIFERKYGEGNHIFEFSANKVGASYFSVMDDASCIRYWVVNIIASHCFDWSTKQPILSPGGTNKSTEGDPAQYSASASSYAAMLTDKVNLIPIGRDPDFMERYVINTNTSASDSICSCETDDLETKGSGSDQKIQTMSKKNNFGNKAPTLYDSGTDFIQCSTLLSKWNDKIAVNIPRSVHKGQRSPYVGEEVEVPLPSSLTNSSFYGSYKKRPTAKVLEQPLVSDPDNFRVHGAGGKNTGPIGSSVNDDSKFVKARVDNKGKKVTISSSAPTNYLPAIIEVDFGRVEGSSLYASGTTSSSINLSKYKYMAPPMASDPKEVLISDEEDGISPATNNDSEETNSLKLESMGIAGPFVPWTQRAMFIQFRSICPAVDITIESKAPHGADFNSAEFSDYYAWDFGEGTEILFKATLPDDYEGSPTQPKFHLPISECSDAQNPFFGREGPIGSPTERGWSKARGSGTKFNKSYRFNSHAGKNNRDFANTNISIYFSFEIGGGFFGGDILTREEKWGEKSPFKDDEWFEKPNSSNGIYWDKRHKPEGNWSRYMKRDFADLWEGAHEQLRGCHCVARNTHDLIIARQPPIVEDKNGIGKAVRIDELNNNNGVGIIFVEGPGQKDGDFDRLL